MRGRGAAVAGALSGGQRRKLSVALALCGGARFVVLDEPTAGVDPVVKAELWAILRAEFAPGAPLAAAAGRTLLFTTHALDEADRHADVVAVMARGWLRCEARPCLKHEYDCCCRLTASPPTDDAAADGEPPRSPGAEPAQRDRALARTRESVPGARRRARCAPLDRGLGGDAAAARAVPAAASRARSSARCCAARRRGGRARARAARRAVALDDTGLEDVFFTTTPPTAPPRAARRRRRRRAARWPPRPRRASATTRRRRPPRRRSRRRPRSRASGSTRRCTTG